jgi:hypothetical protein
VAYFWDGEEEVVPFQKASRLDETAQVTISFSSIQYPNELGTSKMTKLIEVDFGKLVPFLVQCCILFGT